jgi:hypothetical protein
VPWVYGTSVSTTLVPSLSLLSLLTSGIAQSHMITKSLLVSTLAGKHLIPFTST